MDINQMWEKALHNTEILRPVVQGLKTFRETSLPYIFLGESSVNLGDSIIRKGTVIVERPSIIMPPNSPQFDGFELEKEMQMEKESFYNFLFLRGVKFPSLKYDNKTSCLDVYEGRLKKAIKFYSDRLEKEEDERRQTGNP